MERARILPKLSNSVYHVVPPSREPLITPLLAVPSINPAAYTVFVSTIDME
jgi:hypothetical protein